MQASDVVNNLAETLLVLFLSVTKMADRSDSQNANRLSFYPDHMSSCRWTLQSGLKDDFAY